MIAIKTMTDLPEHCWECPCHDGESGYCQADKEHRYSDYRPFWCPLADERGANEQWDELKKIIVELRDNDGTATQKQVCKFLIDMMFRLEKKNYADQQEDKNNE